MFAANSDDLRTSWCFVGASVRHRLCFKFPGSICSRLSFPVLPCKYLDLVPDVPEQAWLLCMFQVCGCDTNYNCINSLRQGFILPLCLCGTKKPPTPIRTTITRHSFIHSCSIHKFPEVSPEAVHHRARSLRSSSGSPPDTRVLGFLMYHLTANLKSASMLQQLYGYISMWNRAQEKLGINSRWS